MSLFDGLKSLINLDLDGLAFGSTIPVQEQDRAIPIVAPADIPGGFEHFCLGLEWAEMLGIEIPIVLDEANHAIDWPVAHSLSPRQRDGT